MYMCIHIHEYLITHHGHDVHAPASACALACAWACACARTCTRALSLGNIAECSFGNMAEQRHAPSHAWAHACLCMSMGSHARAHACACSCMRALAHVHAHAHACAGARASARPRSRLHPSHHVCALVCNPRGLHALDTHGA